MHTGIASGYEAVMYYGKKQDPDFNLDDPRRKQVYQDIYFYFSGSQKTTLNQAKGLLITGNVGVGKSILARVMNEIFKAYRYVHAKRDIERDLKEFNEAYVLRTYGYDFKSSLFIDDVGTGDTVLHQYKNQINVIGELLLERYDLFQATKNTDKHFKTHMITNVTTDGLEQLYAERNFDRFMEMFNLIQWQGESLRK